LLNQRPPSITGWTFAKILRGFCATFITDKFGASFCHADGLSFPKLSLNDRQKLTFIIFEAKILNKIERYISSRYLAISLSGYFYA
jgi:hypothetical protein